jgi:hypothetical protein
VKVIFEVPALTPVTIPLVEPIDAIPVALLLQLPPPSVNVEVEPEHKERAPETEAGKGFIVTVVEV